ncbi:hypothetical protein Trydic_g15727 [Trypoxylus dichotomus]
MGYGRYDGVKDFLKFFMVMTNGLVFIGGIILIAVASWTLACRSFVNELLGTNLYIASVYVTIITGSLAVIIACVGCIGALQEVRCLLVVYWLAMFLTFVTMVVGCVLGFVFRGKVETTVENAMYASLRSYGTHRSATDAWDDTQRNMLCCGVHGPHDWQGRIPDSCCRDSIPGKSQGCQNVAQKNSSILYTDGCLEVTKRYVQSHIIAIAGLAEACVMLLAMAFTCGLYKNMEND